jgi:hypothetical protein
MYDIPACPTEEDPVDNYVWFKCQNNKTKDKFFLTAWYKNKKKS